MPEPPPYQLSEHENTRIYRDRIEPILLATIQESGHAQPRLIMLGGQPGSGKTFRLRNPAEEELARVGGFISIDADEMRTYHPSAERLKNGDVLKTRAMPLRCGFWPSATGAVGSTCCGATKMRNRGAARAA